MSRSDRLLGHGLLLVGCSVAVGALGVVFQSMCGRMLRPSEYGALVALLNAVTVLAVPLQALSVAVTRRTADLHAAGRPGDIRALVALWTRRMTGPALLVLGLSFAAGDWLSDALRIGRAAPAWILGINLALTLAVPATTAALSGVQAFRTVSAYLVLHAVLRILLAWACLTFAFRAAGWVMLGNAGATALAWLFCAVALWRLVPAGPVNAGAAAGGAGGFALLSLPALMGYHVLSAGDVILAKRLFAPDTAGLYAQVAVAARMVIWLPLPVAKAMFPKVTAAADRPARRRLLARTLGITVAMILPPALLFWAAPGWVLRTMFGVDAPAGQLEALRWMILATCPLALLNVMLHYDLARSNFLRQLPLALAGVTFAAAALLHPPAGMTGLILLLLACGTFAVAGNVAVSLMGPAGRETAS